MDEWTTIRISRRLQAILLERGQKNESYDEVITRLISDTENSDGRV
jgi:hypothetical protein